MAHLRFREPPHRTLDAGAKRTLRTGTRGMAAPPPVSAMPLAIAETLAILEASRNPDTPSGRADTDTRRCPPCNPRPPDIVPRDRPNAASR